LGRVIALISGKGGVGKTTVTANLGIALAKRNLKVCVVDSDIAMANLSLLLNMQSCPITLHDVLLGEAALQDAVYDGPNGIKFIPSGLSLENYRRVDPERLETVIKSIKSQFDFIILDAPPGIEKDVLAIMNASEEILLLTTPTAPAIADVLKAKITAQRLGKKTTGVIINMIRSEKGEISDRDIMKMLELPVYGLIPYDDEVRKSFLREKVAPVMSRKPNSPAALSIQKTAAKLAGLPVKFERAERKAGLIAKILSIFRKGEKKRKED
jgi:septum site-determining protein MinD